MGVLDTNHVPELALRTPAGIRLQARLVAAGHDAVIAIVTAEEALRGRMAQIAAACDASSQAVAYERLTALIRFLATYTLLPWDEEAAQRFRRFRVQGIRIGTMDLRIACITLEHDAMLLTRNTVDFAHVPGLRFANRLD